MRVSALLLWLRLFFAASHAADGPFIDVEDGMYSFASRCSGCHGTDPTYVARGPSFTELYGRSTGEISHGGGQTPYDGVNLANLAAYFASVDTNSYTLSGVVIDGQGRGVQGVGITIGSSSVDYVPRRAVSADDGGVRFEGLPPGDHVMTPDSTSLRFSPERFEIRAIKVSDSGSALFGAYGTNEPPPVSLPPATVIRVHPLGDDQASGRAWLAAKRSVSAALAAASPGVEVWVAGGNYHEVLDVQGQRIYGGFVGTETRLEQRDWVRYPSVIDGDPVALSELGLLPNSVMTVSSDPGVTAVCDGLVLQNGSGDSGGGIRLNPGCSAVVDHCLIQSNSAAYSGGGVFCDQLSTLQLKHCQVLKNSSGLGGAIHCSFDSVLEVSENLITDNQASSAAGLYADGFVARMLNNTFTQNASDDGSAAVVQWDGSGINRNNIIAFNSSGIDSFGTQDGWNHNAVFGNTNSDWISLAPGPTDILSDPRFRDVERGDFRLLPASPCLDAGDDGAEQLDALDLDSLPRRSRRHVDIGAYELSAPRLMIETQPLEIQLSWPGEEIGFMAERSSDAGTLNWFQAGAPALVDGKWMVTLPRVQQSSFFRLHQEF